MTSLRSESEPEGFIWAVAAPTVDTQSHTDSTVISRSASLPWPHSDCLTRVTSARDAPSSPVASAADAGLREWHTPARSAPSARSPMEKLRYDREKRPKSRVSLSHPSHPRRGGTGPLPAGCVRRDRRDPSWRPAEISIDDSLIMVTPASDRDMFPAFLYVYVDDADDAYQKALVRQSVHAGGAARHTVRRSTDDGARPVWQYLPYRAPNLGSLTRSIQASIRRFEDGPRFSYGRWPPRTAL